MDDFTIVFIAELWSYEGVRQVLEKAINNSKFIYNMTIELYEYQKQNSYYSHDIVMTIQLYTSEFKKNEPLKHTHTFEDTIDESERDFDFWVDLLEKNQQYSDGKVIISLYVGTNFIKACSTYKRRVACIVQIESQRTTM